jgi:subtilase family serine protease
MIESLPHFLSSFSGIRDIKIAPALKAAGLAAFFLTMMKPAQAQDAAISPMRAAMPRMVVVPDSSLAKTGDLGTRAHSNVRYIESEAGSPGETPPYSGYAYETPASLACLYRVVQPIRECNPNSTTNTPDGGSQTIAIVDAYHDPAAASDLDAFSAQFGLAFSADKFHVVYASGSEPAEDPTGGWEVEESLDIEYAHAMAPHAKLYLVEAKSNEYVDLFTAVRVASNLVLCGSAKTCPAGSKGKGEVSMSWGGSEFTAETSLDSYFTTPGVVYFAAAGDSAGVIYPCASPKVICAGGTSTARSEYTGNLIQEIAWSDAGGGVSFYEPIPGYQKAIPSIADKVGSHRGVPDVSADANPNTGVWVLDTNSVPGAGWYIVGGTSLATPTLAGIANATGKFESSSTAALLNIYAPGSLNYFNDITYGACGYYSGTFAHTGWDLCTGFGSPNLDGK